MNFEDIDYLKSGTSRQKEAYTTLTENQILLKLKEFDPILVGTIPINIDIESSDLDIICSFADRLSFQKLLTDNFKGQTDFHIKAFQSLDKWTIVANFRLNNFEIEIFGQNVPSKLQFAYRHLLAEYELLKKIVNNSDKR